MNPLDRVSDIVSAIAVTRSQRRMMISTLITALLLCSISRVSVSLSEYQDVEVQTGEEVTLPCTNNSKGPTNTFWFRLVNSTKTSCISSMYGFDGSLLYCTGFPKNKYEVSANISTVFLKIKQVDSSDSGLYFCGFYLDGKIAPNVIHLHVQGDESADVTGKSKISVKDPDGPTSLILWILTGVTAFLFMVVIGLVVKIRKIQTAANEERHPQDENVTSNDLNYAALSFQPKAQRRKRPSADREMEPHVVYAAPR